MFFFIKILFRSSLTGLIGYLISILFLIFNRLISYSILSQGQSSRHGDFIGTVLYIITNKLTPEDFTLAFFGFLITTFIAVLWNFEKGRGYF